MRPVAAATRSGHARRRWPGRLSAGNTRQANGSCCGQFRKRAAARSCSPWARRREVQASPTASPSHMQGEGDLANALPAVPRTAGPGAGREGCGGRPHPNPGAAAGCTAWGWAPAERLEEVPAAPAPAFPQGPHALLRQVRSSGVSGGQGDTCDIVGRELTHAWVCSCCRVATSLPGTWLPSPALCPSLLCSSPGPECRVPPVSPRLVSPPPCSCPWWPRHHVWHRRCLLPSLTTS